MVEAAAHPIPYFLQPPAPHGALRRDEGQQLGNPRKLGLYLETMRTALSPFSTAAIGLFLFLSPAQGQQVIDTGTPVELGSLGVGAADHATLATNQFGDVVVANQTVHSNGAKMIEATVITSAGNGQFSIAPPILVGDPSLNLLTEDTCRKPDVTALPDGTFAIAFSRANRQNNQQGNLEIARVRTRDINDLILPTATLMAPAPGQGYVVDANVIPGDGGIMPDLTPLGLNQPSACAVIYASESATTQQVNTVLREYNLLLAGIDFAISPGAPNFIIQPNLIDSNIPADSNPTYPKVGGLVLPDITTDDYENFVITWEEFLLAPHQGLGSGSQGTIVVERRAPLNSPNPLKLHDRLEFSGATSSRQQRRPNVSASRGDATNRVLLSWNDLGKWPALTHTKYKRIEFQNSSGPGHSPPADGFWVDGVLFSDFHSIPLADTDRGFNFAVRDFIFHRRIAISHNGSDGRMSMNYHEMGIIFPWRPAAEIVTVPAGIIGQPDPTYLALLCEGSNRHTQTRYRIHFRVDEF